jgi:Tol biopolymer transport system component
LVYRRSLSQQTQLVWVDRAGKLLEVAAPLGDYGTMALSPDETRVAFTRVGSTDRDLWLLDLKRGAPQPFVRSADNPVWSSDGQTVAFTFFQKDARILDIARRSLDSRTPETLVPVGAPPPLLVPSDWSADDRFLTYYRAEPGTELDVWVYSLDAGTSTPFLRTEFDESQAQFSPNGEWLAYVSDESGKRQIYVQRFPGPGPAVPVSVDGGTQPRWAPTGTEIFFVAPDRTLMAASVSLGESIEIGAIETLFPTTIRSERLANYEVSADGQRFLLNALPAATEMPITVVRNWQGLLPN